jgi:hypothetical protein
MQTETEVNTISKEARQAIRRFPQQDVAACPKTNALLSAYLAELGEDETKRRKVGAW